ncbi:MAG: DsbA family protein [Desulfomonile tiedjei]|nr:DsbA family protein [Desulfomonile tiedjei]
MKQEFPIEDDWVSFELRPETPQEGVLLASRFPEAELKRIYENLRRAGTPLGIVFGEVSVTPNSHLALEAGEYARDHGHFASFHERTFRAYFTEGRDIGRLDVVLDLAREDGLDRGDLAEALRGRRFAQRLAEARREGEGLGVRAVPTFIIDAKHIIVGVQPLEAMGDRLRQITSP